MRGTVEGGEAAYLAGEPARPWLSDQLPWPAASQWPEERVMQVGLDTFTIRELGLDPFATLDFIRERGWRARSLAGYATPSSPELDAEEAAEMRAHADGLVLYTHVSVPTCSRTW